MANTTLAKPPLIKLLLIGESGVGKSCLMVRFAEDTFSESYLSTIGIDFKARDVDVGGQRCSLQVWDTAGQEQFRTITAAFYRGAHGIALVYDVTNRSTFSNITYWMKQMEKYAAEDVCKILIGNKEDLLDMRMVKTSEGLAVAQQHRCEFYETSAKSGLNVEKALTDLAREVKRRQDNTELVKAAQAKAVQLQRAQQQPSQCKCSSG
eukprot:GGOE01065162.1.p1 GENE.GGOE01065162.1~~GGOE01065162.1.p1  ORF type:complete len:227 (+),score=76.27 GGOE01065162.1:58-681(+)